MKHLKQYLPQILLTGILVIAAIVRLQHIATLPPGLYIDEVSIGNNAYSILTKGVDEHGVSYPLWFQAFGEYKMPVMIYMVSGMMFLLGKSEVAVRLPSALLGIGSVLLFYGFLSLLIRETKDSTVRVLPYCGAFLLAVTPWHIHFSRGGFEATIALFFVLVSLYAYLRFVQSYTSAWMLLATVSLALTMYCYNTYRIIAILIFIVYFAYSRLQMKKVGRTLLVYTAFFAALIVPMIVFSLSPEGYERFQQTSAIAVYAKKTLFEQLWLIPMDFLHNYVRYFSFEYLFAVGDQNGRHQLPGFGLFYRIEFVFFIWGLLGSIKRKNEPLFFFTYALLLIAPIPAALTLPSPHALRSLLLVLPITILIAFGMVQFVAWVGKHRKVGIPLAAVLLLIMMAEMTYYYHLMTVHYPKVNAADWGASYKETVLKTRDYAQYDKIVVDQNLGNIAPYFTFYAPEITYEPVPNTWKKPDELAGKKVMLVQPYYNAENKQDRVGIVMKKSINKEIFAEFFAL